MMRLIEQKRVVKRSCVLRVMKMTSLPATIILKDVIMMIIITVCIAIIVWIVRNIKIPKTNEEINHSRRVSVCRHRCCQLHHHFAHRKKFSIERPMPIHRQALKGVLTAGYLSVECFTLNLCVQTIIKCKTSVQ